MAVLLAVSPVLAGDKPVKPGKAETYRVIFQVSDSAPQKWYLTLHNARNVQKALGKDQVRMEILAYGPGLDMLLLETEVAEDLYEAMESGVRIIACENTMSGRKLTRADMHPGIDYVKTGVLHLMKRQRAGWAYVRP
jgi:hypothetical protein